MDISKYNKAEVLAALYNFSKAQGMGFIKDKGNKDMTVEEAQKILDTGQTYFDYLKGRVMKIDLSGNNLNTILYNRDNGLGYAEEVLSLLD